MHESEVVADGDLVRRLLADQFPDWASWTLTALRPTGTDNLIFRLGDTLAVRMPRIESATAQIAVDQEWLPRLAPGLPCSIPTPVAVGLPALGYPFPWAVHTWLPGRNPLPGDHPQLARDLASFVVALSSRTDGPPSSRSGPLSSRDQRVRSSLALLADELDVERAGEIWARSMAAPSHQGPPVWRHADLTPGNLLTSHGRLTGVIDFGPSGLGDPAADLVPAWRVFRGGSRQDFRERVGGDDATWERARGWALSIAVFELAYYRTRSVDLADAARTALRELLAP